MPSSVLTPIVCYFPVFAGAWCALAAIMWIIWLIIGIWVYKDAEKRGKSGILWFLIVFFIGIIGLIIYFLVRDSKSDLLDSVGGSSHKVERRCPNCGREIPNDARVCPYCGKQFHQY
jgi:hypothetical protein